MHDIGIFRIIKPFNLILNDRSFVCTEFEFVFQETREEKEAVLYKLKKKLK